MKTPENVAISSTDVDFTGRISYKQQGIDTPLNLMPRGIYGP